MTKPQHSKGAGFSFTRAARTEARTSIEQDLAAGGRKFRIVQRDTGRHSLASISLKRTGSLRWYAYLRFSIGERTFSVYVAPARGATREVALANAWRIVKEKSLTDLVQKAMGSAAD